MPPKLVIFDCDGVLVDTEGPTNEVLAINLAGYGLKLNAAECVELFVGGTMASVGKHVRAMGYPLPENWTDEMYAQMFERLSQGVEKIPGIEAVLDELDRAQIPYCVGSNGPMEKMEITLVNTGLMDRLRGRIYSPHSIGLEHAKPSGGLYLHAARDMGFEPTDCVVIEDSANGAKGAKNAGILCFGYTAETPAQVLEAEGAIPFKNMNEIPKLLGL